MWNTVYLAEPCTSHRPVRRPLCRLLCFRPESAVLSTLWLTSSLSRTTSCPRTRVDTRMCHRPPSLRHLQPFWLARVIQPALNTTPNRVLVPTKLYRLVASRSSSTEAENLITGPRTRTTEVLQSTSPLCHPFIGSFSRPLGRCTTAVFQAVSIYPGTYGWCRRLLAVAHIC